MKALPHLSLVACMFAASLAHAGMNSNSSSDDYDLETGIYVQLVNTTALDKSSDAEAYIASKSGDYHPNINLFIYNAKDNTSRHLFNNNYGEIRTYVLETAFQENVDAKNKTQEKKGHYVYLAGNEKVKNDVDVIQRPVNNNILIETYHSKTKTYTVWKANKLVGEAKVLFSYQTPSQWHVDAKNQVVRLVTPFIQSQQPRLKVTNYAW
ncbi:MAG: hypothetical protein HOP06_11100 [Methylotenera sp.]|nr:hypothetical protein [Methylotenera sp.]